MEISTSTVLAALTVLVFVLAAVWRKRRIIAHTIAPQPDEKRRVFLVSVNTHNPELYEYQQYEVHLQPGYTLDQHKADTGFLDDRYISLVVDSVTRPLYNLDHIRYLARDIDDEKLAILRSDPGVTAIGRLGKIRRHRHISPRRK